MKKKSTYLLLSSVLVAVLVNGCSKDLSSGPLPLDLKPTNGGTSALAACQLQSSKEPIRSQYQLGEVAALCDKAILQTDQRLVAIAAIPVEQQKIDNTLLAFEEVMADFSDATTPLIFMGSVSTDSKVSAEGSDCEQKVGQFGVDVFTRRPLYASLARQKTSDPAQARLLSQTLLGFEQNGLKLSDESLAQVKILKSQLSAKESQFSTNLNNEVSTVTLTAEQLAGAQPDFLSRLKKTVDGKFIVTTKSTDYSDVMENVSVAETRKQMQFAYLNRAADANTKLLQEAVFLRQQIAKLLGFSSWADYRTQGRMVKDSETANKFLLNLKDKLAIRNQQDQKQLLDFKKQLDPSAQTLNSWDTSYLSYQLQKRDFNLDNEKIREYFPAATVVAGIFEVYSKLLSVQFVEVTQAKVWADGVKLYEIHNSSDCRLIGYFYTDLIPRPGKYGHAAAFPLIAGRSLDKGIYSLPVSSIVANFTPPSTEVGGKPSLLTHDEVETFFHEFGHIMHQTLTKAPYASLSGSSVAQDFVEAPSQMLENWVWNAKILSQVSGHYLHPEQKLPADLLEKMLTARNFQQGSRYTKQLLFSLYDLNIHSTNGSSDVQKTYDELYQQIIGQESPAGNHFPASFGHIMGGYDAGYYGYLWSEVYAQDMFAQFPVNDLTDSAMGAKYRHVILEQGSMKEAIDILKDFLGREPKTDAFFKKLGL